MSYYQNQGKKPITTGDIPQNSKNKMKKLTCTLLLSTVILFSCHKREYWGVRGKGETVTQTRDIAGFSANRLSCSADVIYTQDSIYSVKVSGQANILDVLTTSVNEGELKVDFERDVWDSKNVRVELRGPRMYSMVISGSGNINSPAVMITEDLDLKVSGSGNISLLGLESGNVAATVSGSGNIEIAGGTSQTSSYVISGSGNISAEFFECRSNTTKVSGSGNVRVYATETLDVTISGSGDVRYRGTPSIDVSVTGSGALRKL